MRVWRIARASGLRGEVRLPEDLAIGQISLLLGALATSPSFVRMRTPRPDHRVLARALREFGVPIAEVADGFRIAGVGLSGLKAPRAALAADASASALCVIVSLLAVSGFGTRVGTDAALAELSLRHWLLPLRARGVHAAGTTRDDGEVLAPVSVAPLLPGEHVLPVEIQIPTGDATTKLALLLTGLYAEGVTAIEEGVLSADHFERALVALGLPLETMGAMTLLDTSSGRPSFEGFEWDVPGDFGLAAHLVALALAVPGSDITLAGVGMNRSRNALFDALRYTGARIDVTPKGDTEGNEPFADVRVRHAALSQLRVGAELAFRSLDDYSALVALVPSVRGRVTVRDMARLRERPGRVIARSVELMRSFGVDASSFDDGFHAECTAPLQAARVPADMPDALKLAACVFAAAAEGVSTLEAPESLDALYPGLRADLRTLGISVTEEDVP